MAASTFNEETRREVAAKALAEKIVEAKALETDCRRADARH